MNRSKGTILIVEDQQKAREFLGEILEEEGYAVLFARDGYEALERIKENNINLVLLDLDLPGIHGMEVLKEALRLKPQQQVVIVSGTGNISMAVEAIERSREDVFVEGLPDYYSIIDTTISLPPYQEELRIRVRPFKKKHSKQWPQGFALIVHSKKSAELLIATLRKAADMIESNIARLPDKEP